MVESTSGQAQDAGSSEGTLMSKSQSCLQAFNFGLGLVHILCSGTPFLTAVDKPISPPCYVPTAMAPNAI